MVNEVYMFWGVNKALNGTTVTVALSVLGNIYYPFHRIQACIPILYTDSQLSGSPPVEKGIKDIKT